MPAQEISKPYNALIKLILVLLLEVHGVCNGFACLSNPCVHGVCLDDLDSSYSCYCIDGYTGIECQTNWDECWSSPCQNGGICIDGIAVFNCSCPPGFVGELCEEDYNECESNPCLNNGTCIDATNGYLCSCLAGYKGIHCEMDVAVCNLTNETRCSNGGKCEEGPGDSFSCKCQPGWTGFFCEMEINECMSAPCQNGAVCIDLHADYICACIFGFTGKNCEERIEMCRESQCQNGALCLLEDNHSVCYCVPDYHGEFCQYQYDECQLGPRCMNGGTCIDGVDNFTCSCPPNLTGVLCECLILGNNSQDCSYVSPAPTTYSIIEFTTKPTETTVPTLYLNTTTFHATSTLEMTTETTTIGTTWDTTLTPYITESTEISTTLEVSPLQVTTTTDFTTSTTEKIDTTTMLTTESSDTTTTTTTTTEPIVTTEESSSSVATVATTPDTTTIMIPEETTTEKDISVTITPISVSTIAKETTTESYTTERFTTEGSTTTSTYVTSSNFSGFSSMSTPFTSSKFPPTEITEATTEMVVTITIGNRTEKTVSTSPTDFPVTSVSTATSEKLQTTEEIATSTTTEVAEITTKIYLDCTKIDSHCLNGGTCVFSEGEYKCICPFDTEGLLCEVHLGIRNAAFAGDSHLSHRLINTNNINLEFKAKTFSSNGLIFYAELDDSYMALYIINGYLKFKFSCGYQTMLLSELKVPVNDGNEMSIRAELEFSNDKKHCDASIKVNNTLSMTGDQIAITNKYTKSTAWLHLGGLPQEYIDDDFPATGFVGCMNDLMISGKKVHIFKDAEDGFEVTECSSFACLSSPCANGATCSSNASNGSWYCSCKDGYTGKMCEKSFCDNNPCLFGGTCFPFSGTGYICLCPYGKHGHFCENDLKITEPSFSSSIRGLSSYVAYPVPNGISESMELSFKFIPTTMEQISILMFIGQKGQHDSHSDHLVVSFVKGYIMLTWNLGSGPRRIFTNQPIEAGQTDYTVRIGRLGKRAWLYVDLLGNITGRSPGNQATLDVVPLLYMGGHDASNFSTLPHDLPLHTGFSGCIFDVKLKSGSILIPLQGSREVLGRSVGQCGTTECYQKRCQNGGACLHHGSTFMCLCQDKWYGPLCMSSINPCDSSNHKCAFGSTCVPLLMGYECDCPFGLTGKYCDKYENITDISLTGKRSYISIENLDFDPNNFNIELELRILSSDGLIFFLGKSDFCFVSLSLQSGLLELRIVASTSKTQTTAPLVIRNNQLLVLGDWHQIVVGIFGKKVYLSVDHTISTGTLPATSTLSISQDIIFLGGLPDLSLLPNTAMPGLPLSYTGCVRKFSLDSKHIPLARDNRIDGRNVADCDGTPCGGDACENGGTCWLDSSMIAHCLCVQPYSGERCEKIPSCEKTGCKNFGKCENSKCACKMGWSGIFCETSIKIKTPRFKGTSYLVVERLNDKKRNTRRYETTGLYMNFTTAKLNGLLVWSKQGKNFLGVGIDNGFLKLAYSVGKLNKTFVDVSSFEYVSDGLWHGIEMRFQPFSVKLDKKLTDVTLKLEKSTNLSTLFSNEIFYLGNIPTNDSLFTETNGMFSYTFEGCIEAFGTSEDNVVRDFHDFDGADVDICDV